MRADVEATSTPTSTLRLRRGQSANGAEVEAESKILSYADFVALKPQNRQASGGESSIAGMHVDPVRALLNRLSGGRSDKVEEDGGDVSWMELSDEYADSMPNATHPDPDASPKLEFDRNAFIKAAERYQAHIATSGSEPSPIAAKSCVCGSGLCCWLTLDEARSSVRVCHPQPTNTAGLAWPCVSSRRFSTDRMRQSPSSWLSPAGRICLSTFWRPGRPRFG